MSCCHNSGSLEKALSELSEGHKIRKHLWIWLKGLMKDTGNSPTQKGTRTGCIMGLNEKKIPTARDNLQWQTLHTIIVCEGKKKKKTCVWSITGHWRPNAQKSECSNHSM